jgi:hypothetical protein
MTADTYTAQRIRRLELELLQHQAKIRDLEDRCFRAESALAALDHIHGVPA